MASSVYIEKIKYETYYNINVLKKVYIKSYYRNKVIDSFDKTIIDQASKRQIKKLTKKFHALLRILIKGIISEEEFIKMYNSAILLNLEIEQILHSKIKYKQLKRKKGYRAYNKLEDILFCVNDLYPKSTLLTLFDHHLDIVVLILFLSIMTFFMMKCFTTTNTMNQLLYSLLLSSSVFLLPTLFIRVANYLHRSSRLQLNKFAFSYQHKTINKDFLNQTVLNKIDKI